MSASLPPVYQTYRLTAPDAASCAAIGQAFLDQGGPSQARCAQYTSGSQCWIHYDLGHYPAQVGLVPGPDVAGSFGNRGPSIGAPSNSRPSITTAEGDDYKVIHAGTGKCSAWSQDTKSCLGRFTNLFNFAAGLDTAGGDTCMPASGDPCAVPATCASCRGHTGLHGGPRDMVILLDGCTGV